MKLKRPISFVTLLILILSLIPCITATATTDTTVVLACSDFQNEQGNEAGKVLVKSLLDVISDIGITSADGFLCCGDYDYEYTDTKGGVDALKEVTADFVTGESVYTQGNHDSEIGTNGMSPSGSCDPASGKYGVFNINEDDYMWYNNNEERIKLTAQSLVDYFNKKLEQGFEKPIFVLSHLPLHYSMRTKNDGDGQHANYLFNVINTAGAKGLNIIFMYGHDHSNGWDDYLGGAAVYLKKGDSILIAQNSQTVFKEETLNFTYTNPGFVGYYRNVNGADNALTMTTWEITDDIVTAKRYSDDGLHNMKSAGVTNSYKNESGYSPNTTVYTSPQTITLTDVTDKTPIPDIIQRPESGKTSGYIYKRITNLTDIKDGQQYLLVYNSTSDYIMTTKVATKSNSSGSRTGYDIIRYKDFGANQWIDSLDRHLWTFEKANNGWKIGNGTEYIDFEGTSTQSASALLTSSGEVITIGGSADMFTFSGDSYTLNYNSRGVINGYDSNPASFFIYEYTGKTYKDPKSEIFDGLYYTNDYTYTDEGSNVNTFVIEIDSSTDCLQVVTGVPNDETPLKPGAVQTTTGHAESAEKNGKNVIAAINADFFNINNSDMIQPCGITIKDGVKLTDYTTTTGNRSYFFGIKKDGTPVIGDKTVFDSVEAQLNHAVGGGPWLVKNGEVQSTEDVRHPRTAIGIKADGSIIMVVADGRSDISAGLTFDELAHYMKALGAIEALNLDGGGSSAMVVENPDTHLFETKNVPSDGSERPVGNTLLVLNHNYDDVCDDSCDCGYTRTVTHNYGIKYSDTQHWQECLLCHNKALITGHIFDNNCNTSCECGYTREPKHNYQTKYDSTNHWSECAICHSKKDSVKHIFSNACDRYCDICAYTRSIIHIYDNDFDSLCNVCDTERTAPNTPTKAFIDVKVGSWYKKYVDYAVAYGMFAGTSNIHFSPETPMTRAQFVKVLSNLSGVSVNNSVSSEFNDVPSNKWYTGAIRWAADNGIVSGMGGGRFEPDTEIDRQQMCVMLVNYVEQYQKSTLKKTKAYSGFSDEAQIAKWAQDAIVKCFESGLVSGTGNNRFSPKDVATRAQGATIFTNFHKEYIA